MSYLTRSALLLALVVLVSCTSRYQLRGTESAYYIWAPPGAPPGIPPLDQFIPNHLFKLDEFVGTGAEARARQLMMEHRSVETFTDFTLGVIEIEDDGHVNVAQSSQVMTMVRQKTQKGGLLVVFVHGWHHGARTCDRDLCCFRRFLQQLAVLRRGRFEDEDVVGVYIAWRGEAVSAPIANVFSIYNRKRVAEHLGRATGRDILLELKELWQDNDNLLMITIGHSLGGALVFQAVRENLTGDVAGILAPPGHSYRIVRARGDRVKALRGQRKALRADFGDLVILMNPAIESSEYEVFDADLLGRRVKSEREALVEQGFPYDKNDPYDSEQVPIILTMATQKDGANRRLFPFARFLQSLLNLRWGDFAQQASLIALGQYGPHVTHQLTHGPPERCPDRVSTATENCDCPFPFTRPSETGSRLRHSTDNPQHFAGFTLEVTAQRRARGWDIHSPYWVVETDGQVMCDHNDIFNPHAVEFLLQFLEAYDREEPEVRIRRRQ